MAGQSANFIFRKYNKTQTDSKAGSVQLCKVAECLRNDNATPNANIHNDSTRLNFIGIGNHGRTSPMATKTERKHLDMDIRLTAGTKIGAARQNKKRNLTYHNGGFAIGNSDMMPNCRSKSNPDSPSRHHKK